MNWCLECRYTQRDKPCNHPDNPMQVGSKNEVKYPAHLGLMPCWKKRRGVK